MVIVLEKVEKQGEEELEKRHLWQLEPKQETDSTSKWKQYVQSIKKTIYKSVGKTQRTKKKEAVMFPAKTSGYSYCSSAGRNYKRGQLSPSERMAIGQSGEDPCQELWLCVDQQRTRQLRQVRLTVQRQAQRTIQCASGRAKVKHSTRYPIWGMNSIPQQFFQLPS